MARVKFTVGRIADFACQEKQQAFLWDSEVPGLGVRATAGAKGYIFQARAGGKTLRVTIGDVRSWTIPQAQAEGRRLQILIDSGQDPRQVKSDAQTHALALQAAKVAEKTAKQKQADIDKAKLELIARVAWNAYLAAPHPKWGDQHRTDHLIASGEGGVERKIGTQKTKPAPLASLLSKPLHEITASVVQDWLAHECTTRPTFAHNSFRKFRTFVRWCAKHSEFQHSVHADCCMTDEVKDIVPKSKTKVGDCLQREQLFDWFGGVCKIGSPVISAYLQALLITGARRGELEILKWADVDFRWSSMIIRDKVEGLRTIPLTPYLAQLLTTLPRRSEWVFSSPTAASGHIMEPRIAHTQALKAAGLPHVSLHGLRRSFGTLSEWVEVPTGVVAQIQGHKPSALAEKHYRRRPLDLLRMWHTKVEAWMLDQAGINFVSVVPALRVVGA